MASDSKTVASHMFDFEDITVGQIAELTHLLTLEDVRAFAALTGDLNPLHLDESFARKTVFRKPVVYGMLSASFISTMIGMLLPGHGALWTSQTLSFLAPAFVGDMLRVTACVKQKSPATRMLVLDIKVANQRNENLITGEATVKMMELEKERMVEINSTKTILITGASRGIGAATARRLSKDGHRVLINYIHSSQQADELVAEITQAGGHALSLKADVTNEKEVEVMFAKGLEAFGPVQGVVHCAGVASAMRTFEDLDWKTIQLQFELQVRGAFNCIKAALPQMLAALSGDIVLVGSIATDGTPPKQQADYVIAKSALAALARCLAVEYGPKGIRINVVAPGMTQTDMTTSIPEKAKMLTRMQTPLRRLGEPEEIADAIAFLLSPGARYITGETIRVCGGSSMQ